MITNDARRDVWRQWSAARDSDAKKFVADLLDDFRELQIEYDEMRRLARKDPLVALDLIEKDIARMKELRMETEKTLRGDK